MTNVASKGPRRLAAAANGKARRAGSRGVRPQFVLDVVDGCVHLIGACIFLFVFSWHFTEPAKLLPASKSFGWFYKFLTFWGWTLQTIQYPLACLVAVVPSKLRIKQPLLRWSDDVSCLAFTVASTITLMFWVLHIVTGGMVERSVNRPPWLGFSVHVLNAIFAWLDIALSRPRSFSKRSSWMCVVFCFTYASWIAVCRYYNGVYPYPFMNLMPPLVAYFGMFAAANVVLYSMTVVGRTVAGSSASFFGKDDPYRHQRLRVA